jgi:Undecaprenyl-phosphate galactose phosphotransferase WbaP
LFPTLAVRRVALVVALFLVVDIVVLQGLVAISLVVRQFLQPWLPIGLAPEVFRGVQLGLLLLPAAFAAAGLYPGYGQTAVERLRKRVIVSFGYCVLMMCFDYLAQGGQWSRGMLLIFSVLVIVAVPIFDALFISFLIRVGLWGEPVAVFGPVERRQQIVAALIAQPQLGWRPVSHADLEEARVRPQGDISVALVVLSADQHLIPSDVDAMAYGRVIVVPYLGDMQSLWVTARDIGSYLGLEMRRNLLLVGNRVIKRALDIVFGTVLLIVAVPVVLPLALIVKIISPGPAFFLQSRHGLHQRPFDMIKLRTMVVGAEGVLQSLLANSPEARAEWAEKLKLRRDPRIIPLVGALMRRFSLDELPQLWNVVRGDMSLVGPRPLPAYHLEAFSVQMRHLRALVQPGITGLWQVSGRSDVGIDDQQRMDAYYLRNWSLWLDIYILMRTFAAVVRGRGAR